MDDTRTVNLNNGTGADNGAQEDISVKAENGAGVDSTVKESTVKAEITVKTEDMVETEDAAETAVLPAAAPPVADNRAVAGNGDKAAQVAEETKKALTPAQRVALARSISRPGTMQFIKALFTDFFEQKGDRLGGEDPAILGGVALFHGQPVTVLGHRKGKSLDENVRCRFGMPTAEGYRKVQRLLRAAEKFRRPVITFIDTPGAYPGLEAEARGQGEAIARCLALMSTLKTPLLTVVIGEGGSGGALALAMGNRVLMLENAVYSILSPEGFASILWKDKNRAGEACDVMKLTAADLLKLGVIDEILPEPEGGARSAGPGAKEIFRTVDRALQRHLTELQKQSDPARARYQKFRGMGNSFLQVASKENL